jgi:hypothetical protein
MRPTSTVLTRDEYQGPLEWVGPFAVRTMLDRCLDDSFLHPPDAGSAYFVSQRRWETFPSSACGPLYIGGNTSQSPYFRTRIGSLIADLFGFFNESEMKGHHTGAMSVHQWCRANGVHPSKLFIGWVKPGPCHRCLEYYLYLKFSVEPNRLLNVKAPAECKDHERYPSWR